MVHEWQKEIISESLPPEYMQCADTTTNLQYSRAYPLFTMLAAPVTAMPRKVRVEVPVTLASRMAEVKPLATATVMAGTEVTSTPASWSAGKLHAAACSQTQESQLQLCSLAQDCNLVELSDADKAEVRKYDAPWQHT